MNTDRLPLSLYLHIPFCTTKCTYCAFNTYINLEKLIPSFVSALCAEIDFLGQGDGIPTRRVETIFFGGGTPTLLNPDQFRQIFAAIHRQFEVSPSAEITTEANPNDLDLPYLQGLRDAGFNRLSLGMQSSNPSELKLFARRHDHEVVQRVMPQARQAGFDNINLDLIYGIPHQTLQTWQATLDSTLQLAPEHISLYALGLEDDTPLKEWVDTRRVPEPDDDLAVAMYELATDVLGRAGYLQYEISNWAKPDHECRHNLQYWRNHPYAGVGPGAHGWAGGVRYATILSPAGYIRSIEEGRSKSYTFPSTPATVDEVRVSQADEIAETLIMGLRLMQEGINLAEFQARFGVDLRHLHREALERFSQSGLLTVSSTQVRLTEQGRMLSNLVFRELV